MDTTNTTESPAVERSVPVENIEYARSEVQKLHDMRKAHRDNPKTTIHDAIVSKGAVQAYEVALMLFDELIRESAK